jgi:alpha-N-acetylglucosaminidase
MKLTASSTLFIFLIVLFSMAGCKNNADSKGQILHAKGVISRVLPAYADMFSLKIIEKKGDEQFIIEPSDGKVLISGTSGIALCSGFNYYLRKVCNATYNWRCGNNLNISGKLPLDFQKITKTSPYKYRYIFNYCTFSYSMAFWDWEQWEKMIDWMAMNGINMPLAPMGQELIWQKVYAKYGLSTEDLRDFFVGPAYNAFGRMGCIDGFGGPLPQSWINDESVLQKKILERERGLGMTPVLQGFTGHIPPSLTRKIPGLKYTNLYWIDFPGTYLLDLKDPMFSKISEDFIIEQTREYGTDHLYAIDQFIEMQPSIGDTAYLKNMSGSIFSSLNKADPDAKWVIQTWPFKELIWWSPSRTKAYFDGVPDDRMIALELMGESWQYTGWYKHSGWYGKPWVWSVISNFGDNVSMFGGLGQITENLSRALDSQSKGRLSGMGMMMEGLDYNPVIYQLVADLMWEEKVPDLKEWKGDYLKSRYTYLDDTLLKAWDNIFDYYYSNSGLFESNPVVRRPFLVKDDIKPSQQAAGAAGGFIASMDKLRENDAFRFDLVNLLRQVFGQYSGHILHEITMNYEKNDIREFDLNVRRFIDLATGTEKLLETRDEFLAGKWIADSRKHAHDAEEEKLYEWNARAIITTWGGRSLYGYANKDWAGMYSCYYIPKWKLLFDAMRTEMQGGKKLDYDKFINDLKAWEDNWIPLRNQDMATVPTGDPVELAADLWKRYGTELTKAD